MKNIDIIFGLHASICALNNKKRKIIRLRCTHEALNKIKKSLKEDTFKFEIVTRKFLDTVLKHKFHQGVLIESYKLKEKSYHEILKNYNSNILILDSLTDPQNVGSILRSAYLFGISLVFYNENNSFHINSLLFKSASGAYEKVSLIKIVNINKLIEELKEQRYWIIGLDLKSKITLKKIPNDVKKVIILGSENKGIRPLIKRNCDYLVNITMKKNDEFIDSLNISNAASITFYELSKNEL